MPEGAKLGLRWETFNDIGQLNSIEKRLNIVLLITLI